MKNHIKKRTAETDMPTKEIVADSLGTFDFEAMANLNCQINTLSKMSRLSRQNANRHPPVPTSLENLAIPPSYMTNNQGDTVLAGLPRSNNLVEGWHNGFQKLVGCSNPTLWTFLTAPKKEENLTTGPTTSTTPWRTCTVSGRCCSRAK